MLRTQAGKQVLGCTRCVAGKPPVRRWHLVVVADGHDLIVLDCWLVLAPAQLVDDVQGLVGDSGRETFDEMVLVRDGATLRDRVSIQRKA